MPNLQVLSLTHRASLVLAASLILSTGTPASNAASQGPTSDTQAVRWLQNYLQFDTSNPPGDEAAAVAFLAEILHSNGHSTRRFVSPEGRTSLLAKITATSSTDATEDRAPLLLLHHIDVVPPGAGWTKEPFGGERSRGLIHGRGAIDSKSLGIAHLAAFLELGRSPELLGRDLWYLASADEEAGGAQGVGWIFERYPDELGKVGAVITEAGINRVINGKPVWWGIEVAQKRALWLRLTTRARGGHGSSYHPSSATHQMVRALERVLALEMRPRLSPSAFAFFKALLPYHGVGYQTLFDHQTIQEAQAALDLATQEQRLHKALLPGMINYLLDTIQVTRIGNESTSVNVVSATATAELDARLLPDTDDAAFLERIRSAMGKFVEIEILLRSNQVETPSLKDPTYQRLAEHLGAITAVVPTFIPGTTDSRYFRERGIPAYGFSPFLLSGNESRGIHGADESIPEARFLEGVRRTVATVRAIVSQ